MNLEEKYLVKEAGLNKMDLMKYQNYYEVILLPFIGKKIKGKGWTFGFDSMVGSFYFFKKDSDTVVYATPYWELNNGIVIDVNEDGYTQYQTVINIPKPSGDSKKDATVYFEKVTKNYLT